MLNQNTNRTSEDAASTLQKEGGDKEEIEMRADPEKQKGEEDDKLMDEDDLDRDEIDKIQFLVKVQMESEPSDWALVVTRYPFFCFCASYILFAGLFVLCIIFEFYTFDKPSPRDYLVWNDPIVQNWDKRAAGIKYFENRDSWQIAERLEYNKDWSCFFIYENTKTDDGILGDLDKIKAFETEIKSSDDWPQYCESAGLADLACKETWVQSTLDPFQNEGRLAITEATTVLQARSALNTAIGSSNWERDYAQHFEKDLRGGANDEIQYKVSYMRSNFRIGAPLNGYQNLNDKPEEQKAKIANFLKTFDKLIEGKNELWESSGLKVRIYSKILDELVFDEVMQQDSYWVLATILFSFLWLLLHTNSMIISLVGFTIMVVTFPAAMLICEGIFNIKYMSGLHLMTVIIVIAVSMNNILVMFDTWYQTKQLCNHIFMDDLEKRMSYVLRRSASGIFMTCTTTAVVLLGNAWSPLMPVRSVCIFAGVLVAVNFFYTIMVLPPTLVIYDKIETACCKRDADRRGSVVSDNKSQINELDEQYSGIDRFFGEKWNWCTGTLAGKIIFFLLFIGWTGFAAYTSIEIEFKTYNEEFVPADHPAQVAKTLYNDMFFGSEDLSRVYFVWGIDDVDISNTSQWDSRDIGEAIIDRNFDPIEKETFQKLMDFCTDLQSKSFVVPDSVDCWVQDLYEYTQQNGIKWVPSNKFAAQNYFIEWLKNTDSGRTARDFEKLGVVDGKITYMQISAQSGINTTDRLSKKISEYNKWQDFAKKWQSKLPVTAKSIFQTSQDAWAWIPTQVLIQEEAINGVIVAACFCFTVVLFASQNIVMAILCILCLFSIFVTMLGILQLLGWKLGLTELLLLVIIMGLSVDNTIHMAHDYTHAPHIERRNKMKQAYLQKGKTITSASINTLFCACFLFGAQNTVFFYYAISIIGTMIISYIVSMFFFGAMCHLFGPTSGCGDLCGRLPGQEKEEEMEMIRIKQEMQV